MKISKRTVDTLKPGAVAWEHGFGVRANGDGTKSYLLSYRIGRRKRRYTIGTHGALTVEQARKRAHELMVDIRKGTDPLAVKSATRSAPTMSELAERFLREHVDPRRAAATRREYARLLDHHIVPALGHQAITEVTRADVVALHHRLRATPRQANLVIAVLSKMMSMGEKWGLRQDGTNPCRHVEKYAEAKRQRYLNPAEFKRLGAVLAAADRGPVVVDGEPEPVRLSPMALRGIALLIFTGARRGEILTLKWEQVDLDRGVLTLSTSKTGFKVVHLNQPAIAILSALPRVDHHPYVLPGQRHGKPLVNISDTWSNVRDLAGLKDVRLHDLRHSLASVAAGAGIGLHTIGGLLGHSQPATTARYAHLAADPLKQASELIGATIARALEGRP